MQSFSSYNWFTPQWEPLNGHCSAMQWPTGLQFYYVTPDPKVGEQHIQRKYSKFNSFHGATDLLNSDNLKVAIAQLCNELQAWYFTML